MTIEIAERLRKKLQKSLDELIQKIGPIQIGTQKQFPYGWGSAAKGRTVWRILEEVIIQNLKDSHSKIGIETISPSSSEVSVHDFSAVLKDEEQPVFVNVKSAVSGGKTQKDDISKGKGLNAFYEDDPTKHFFVATFFIKFNADMTIEIEKCVVFPIAWVPDIYINPSNNGNLQSSKYKDLSNAVKRTPTEFFKLLKEAIKVADAKKAKK